MYSKEVKKSTYLKFQVKTKESLGIQAWSRIENSNSCIKKSEMTAEQTEVYHSLCRFFVQKLLKKGFKSINLSWRKSKTGYTLYNNCDQTKGCSSVWTLKLRVPSGLGHIYFTRKCDHVDQK